MSSAFLHALRATVYAFLAFVVFIPVFLRVAGLLGFHPWSRLFYLSIGGPTMDLLWIPALILATRRIYLVVTRRGPWAPQSMRGWLLAICTFVAVTHASTVTLALTLPASSTLASSIYRWSSWVILMVPVVFVLAEVLTLRRAEPPTRAT